MTMTDPDASSDASASSDGVDRDDGAAPVVRRRRSQADAGAAPGRTGRGSRPGGSRGRPTLWWQLATTSTFAVLLVGLGFTGYRASLLITGGNSSKVTDPAAPGYVAEVRPTTVDLVALTGDDGSLASVLIVSTPKSGSGGTVSVLPATIAPGPGQDGSYRSLKALFAEGGLDELRSQLGIGMTFGFTSGEQVSSQTLKTLAGLTGPVTVPLMDNLIDSPQRGKVLVDRSTETVRYRAGDLRLEPDQVASFLAFDGLREEPDSELLRQEATWRALFEGLKGKDLSRVAQGDGANGGGAVTDLFAQLLGGEVTFETVPTAPRNIPGTIFNAFVPDPAGLPTYVSRVVPFPTSAFPGQRARVELLNGTTKKDAALLVSPKVVAAGGEISLLGNGPSFDERSTRVEYLAPEAKDAAEQIARTLGVKAQRSTSKTGGIDVRVVVGADRTS